VLVVDDEPGIRQALKQVLEYEGLEVRAAASGGEAITLYPDARPDLVFLDVKMAGLDGLATLHRLRALDPGAVIVMISGHATIATAVEATQAGAFDFLEKPLDTDRLLVTVRNALSHASLVGENSRLRAAMDRRYAMIGDSPVVLELRALIAKVGPTGARVLITGENGTGKELVARAIHLASPRRDHAFVEVNCAAIPSELIESELFGHMKGSFTGAVTDRAGKFEQASGGTLFLDEIDSMPLSMQAKLLRALQERVIERLGSNRNIPVDLRPIAASKLDLRAASSDGRFRSDLYYRLSVAELTIPPLRDRIEDVPLLFEYFAASAAAAHGRELRPVTSATLSMLIAHQWPGNVRELRNAAERYALGLTGPLMPQAADTGSERLSLADQVEAFERALIERCLTETGGRINAVLERLKIPRRTLSEKMVRLGIDRQRFKTSDGPIAAEDSGAIGGKLPNR
jgi:DNA-binding NtrC family response regulator